ncbi:MAG: DUF4242 domain-containing protein [Cyclobacteriaceae bacterium]|nr:DUF4242 domain-containing protein [Cyclobacteriaceae bacterium]
MPIYMDRHDLPGVTARDVAEAHQADLKVQDKFGCRGLTYWFDETRGIAFCLVEAPDKEAVKEMHDHAHGLIPHQILEVDNSLVEAFLGRIEDPENLTGSEDPHLSQQDRTAIRTILYTDLKRSPFALSDHGEINDSGHYKMFNKIVRTQVKNHEGREVEHGGSGFLISFSSASNGMRCAHGMLEEFKLKDNGSSTKGFQICAGLSAGMPVTEDYDFFEQAVLSARRLCFLAESGKILVAPEVLDLLNREDISFFKDSSHIKMLNPKDEKFIHQLLDILEDHWNNSNFNVLEFCKKIGLSKSQLNRKISALSGFSPNEFIKEFRLNKAAALIEKGAGNIAEIAYEAGFTSPSYFSKCFHKRFGFTPSNLITPHD